MGEHTAALYGGTHRGFVWGNTPRLDSNRRRTKTVTNIQATMPIIIIIIIIIMTRKQTTLYQNAQYWQQNST
jgi:hypothetical protein